MPGKKYAAPRLGKAVDDRSECLFYTGSSMNPLLTDGDIVRIKPYDNRDIQNGDVIVFRRPGGNRKIIHRVTAVDAQGVRTQGDNSNKADPWVLPPNKIFGRVVTAKRKKGQRQIAGAFKGRIWALHWRIIRLISHAAFLLLRPPYRCFSRSGVFWRWKPFRLKTRLISFDRPDGRELQLIAGSRVIGRLLPGREEWKIRPPFRLFIDESSLRKEVKRTE